jgi:Lar family restriction alleviation protein
MKDINTEALKPCPFCGSQANIETNGYASWVACTQCQCTGDDGSQDTVIAAWNKRASPPVTPVDEQKVRDEALQEALHAADLVRLALSEKYKENLAAGTSPMEGNLDWMRLEGAVRTVDAIRKLQSLSPPAVAEVNVQASEWNAAIEAAANIAKKYEGDASDESADCAPTMITEEILSLKRQPSEISEKTEGDTE